jgi:ubiquinone/menaquinone biosynthesis C-methylase UbiE
MSNFLGSSQHDYFASTCEKRYEWQTQNPFISQAERDILSCLPITPGNKVLELGCGTGSNIFNLRAMGKVFKFTGIDINDKEISLARRNFPMDEFILGDATNVALHDESFDLVFCRDLMHHMGFSQHLKLIQEMTRLAKVDGQVVLIESNGLNFVVWVFAKLVKVERDVLHSTPERIAKLFGKIENLNSITPTPKFVEPCNFFRFILHYQFGLPWLAQSRSIQRVLKKISQLTAKTLPPHRWAYMIFTSVKRG